MLGRFERRTPPRRWPRLGALALTLALAPACKREAVTEKRVAPPSGAEKRTIERALTTYADIAYASYSDAAESARSLLRVIDRFLGAPSAAGLAEARSAWQSARHPYQQTEVFRFYDGPIDRVEMRVNTWPIDESYVENDVDGGRRGIIDDAQSYPALTTALLATLNSKEGETSISSGYHVIEFLLWGKDTRVDGPGDRPHTDYVGDPGSRAARRARYLRLAVELLIMDLESVRDAWAPNVPGNYRAAFAQRPPLEALGLVTAGMGALSGPELSGERLTVAYATKAQENEHSCFSDNTVADLSDDAIEIQNVCRGHYERSAGAAVHGTGFCEAVRARDPVLGAELERDIAASVEKVRAIPAPFDQAMLGDDAAPGRVAMKDAISALERQAAALAKVAAKYDVRLAAIPNRSSR